MKSQILPGHKNHIILSGEIDPRYTVPPGTYVTFAKGSSFQEKDVSGEIFHNDEYIVKSFKQNLLGKIELTPLVIDSPSSSPLCELPLDPHFLESPNVPTTPTGEKECWLTPPASPPSIIEPESPLLQPGSPPPPTLHRELSAPPGLSFREALEADLSNEQTLAGQSPEESACCCSIS
jgi:hypothetical protein